MHRDIASWNPMWTFKAANSFSLTWRNSGVLRMIVVPGCFGGGATLSGTIKGWRGRSINTNLVIHPRSFSWDFASLVCDQSRPGVSRYSPEASENRRVAGNTGSPVGKP